MTDLLIVVSSAGLVLGTAGAIALALLSDGPRINPDGSVSLGFAPPQLSEAQVKSWNRGRANLKRRATPLSYAAIACGFLMQLLALWIPAVVGSTPNNQPRTVVSPIESEQARNKAQLNPPQDHLDIGSAVVVPNVFNKFDCSDKQVVRYDRTGRAICLTPPNLGGPWEKYQDDPLAKMGDTCKGDLVKVYDESRSEYCVSLERIDHIGGTGR